MARDLAQQQLWRDRIEEMPPERTEYTGVVPTK